MDTRPTLVRRRSDLFVWTAGLFGVVIRRVALKIWNRIVAYFMPQIQTSGHRIIVRKIWDSENGGYIVTAKLSAWMKWQKNKVIDEYPLFRAIPVSRLEDYKLGQIVEL